MKEEFANITEILERNARARRRTASPTSPGPRQSFSITVWKGRPQ